MSKKQPIRSHIRAWRLEVGLTLLQAAIATGMDSANLSRAERGLAGMDDASFAALAQAYGITVAELSAPPEERHRAKQMGRVMAALQTLDEKSLAALAELAERMRT